MERIITMKGCVLDTSVVIKWFSEYNEDDLDKALSLRDKILKGDYTVTVPDLIFYELANALRYNPQLNIKDVNDAINSVIDLGFEIKGIDEITLAHAVETAYKFKVTVYDAYFLALSQIVNKPFITADYKFAEKVTGLKKIIRLSEI